MEFIAVFDLNNIKQMHVHLPRLNELSYVRLLWLKEHIRVAAQVI